MKRVVVLAVFGPSGPRCECCRRRSAHPRPQAQCGGDRSAAGAFGRRCRAGTPSPWQAREGGAMHARVRSVHPARA